LSHTLLVGSASTLGTVARCNDHLRVEAGWIRCQDAHVQITAAVPYDEQQLRATLAFIIRPQVKRIRIYGWVMLVCGLILFPLALSEPDFAATVFGLLLLVLGAYFAFGVKPAAISRAIRRQPRMVRDGYWLSLDDEWLAVSYPLVQSRYRWAGLESVVDTPQAWYVRFSRYQAIAIPKAPLTPEQQAEFVAFLAHRQLVAQG
jgi:hypothetical protein